MVPPAWTAGWVTSVAAVAGHTWGWCRRMRAGHGRLCCCKILGPRHVPGSCWTSSNHNLLEHNHSAIYSPYARNRFITYLRIKLQNKEISLQNDANFGLHIVVWFGQVSFDVSFFSGLENTLTAHVLFWASADRDRIIEGAARQERRMLTSR